MGSVTPKYRVPLWIEQLFGYFHESVTYVSALLLILLLSLGFSISCYLVLQPQERNIKERLFYCGLQFLTG
jgi:hypothetical protein